MPPEEAGAERARPVSGDSQPGLCGAVTQARHVNRQERKNEGSELVKESSEEKNPGAARQGSQVFSQARMCFVHGVRFALVASSRGQTKNPPTFQRVGLENLVRVT